MPGSMSTVEALLRGEHQPVATADIAHSLLAVNRLLLASLTVTSQIHIIPSPSLSLAWTSLAATLIKLLHHGTLAPISCAEGAGLGVKAFADLK